MLDDETIYGVFRTDVGRVGDFSVTTNGSGLTTEWARQPDGDTVYNPRAKAELFDFGAGRYLLWHHAMSGTSWEKPTRARADARVGARVGDRLVWSKPTGIAFNTQTQMMSYPSAILSADGQEIIFAATDKASAQCWRMPASDFF